MIQLLFFSGAASVCKEDKIPPHPRRAGATSLPSESLNENFLSALAELWMGKLRHGSNAKPKWSPRVRAVSPLGSLNPPSTLLQLQKGKMQRGGSRHSIAPWQIPRDKGWDQLLRLRTLPAGAPPAASCAPAALHGGADAPSAEQRRPQPFVLMLGTARPARLTVSKPAGNGSSEACTACRRG